MYQLKSDSHAQKQRQSRNALRAHEMSQFLPLPQTVQNNTALKTFVNTICPPSISKRRESSWMKISFSYFLCAAHVRAINDEYGKMCLIVILGVFKDVKHDWLSTGGHGSTAWIAIHLRTIFVSLFQRYPRHPQSLTPSHPTSFLYCCYIFFLVDNIIIAE